MTDRVQYLPLGLGTEHLIRPLIRGNINFDRVELLVPDDADDSLGMISATKSELEDTLWLDVSVHTVDTREFAAVVAQGYDDLLKELDRGNEVYINVASPYWSLGAGYATAAQYLLAELTQGDNTHLSDIPAPRNRISIYYTEPSGYYISELVEAGQRVKEFRSDFEEVWKVAQELKSDVESDRQTARGIANIFDSDGSGPQNPREIISVLDALGNEPANDDGIGQGIDNILTGIESVTDGIDVLAQKQNREKIENMPFLGPMTNITEGLAEISERTKSDTKHGVTIAALLDYFVDRLDHVHNVLQRVEYLYDDFDDKFTHSTSEFSDILDDVEAHGIAYGVRTYETQQTEFGTQEGNELFFGEVPGHLQFGLAPIQRAILYTLAVSGSADSIQEFTTQVIQHALKTAEETGLRSPEGTDINAIRTGDFDAGTTLLENTLLPAIQSKVQYHLTRLQSDGFIHKKSIGQTTGIEFTRAGSVYAGTQNFDQDWRETAFEGICSIISESYKNGS
jgi:hypothetical protein